MFQVIEMQLQYERNPNSRSGSWERTSINREQQSQSSQRIENPYQDKRSRKLLGICEFLQTIHKKL